MTDHLFAADIQYAIDHLEGSHSEDCQFIATVDGNVARDCTCGIAVAIAGLQRVRASFGRAEPRAAQDDREVLERFTAIGNDLRKEMVGGGADGTVDELHPDEQRFIAELLRRFVASSPPAAPRAPDAPRDDDERDDAVGVVARMTTVDMDESDGSKLVAVQHHTLSDAGGKAVVLTASDFWLLHAAASRSQPAAPAPPDVEVERGLADLQPAVAGRRLTTSIQTFVRNCHALLGEEQAKANPDNAIVGVLCEAIRFSREHIDMANEYFLPIPAAATEAPGADTERLNWLADGGLKP